MINSEKPNMAYIAFLDIFFNFQSQNYVIINVQRINLGFKPKSDLIFAQY